MAIVDPARNFCEVTVSTGYDASATAIALISGHGARLPVPSSEGAFDIVWYNATDYTDPSLDPYVEIVRVTGVGTDTLTVTRAQESTTATAKNIEGKTYKMLLTPTKKLIDDINGAIDTDGTLAGNSDIKIASQKAINTFAGNGWINPPTGSWSFSSADSPTHVITVPAGAKSVYSEGMRVKYLQDQALTAYWNLDANSNSQVGSFNGTDTAISYSAGKFGNAATFNGTTSKIVLADSASLKPTGEFTIGCWFKTSATGAYRTIFQSTSVNTNFAGIKIGISNTNVLYLNIGNNTSSTIFTNISGLTVVTDNAFHYVVVSYRNNYVQIYLDGKLEMSSYCVTPVYAATNYVRIGCENSTGSDAGFFSGQIDDLFLINGYALDEKTIKAKYDAQTAQGTGDITIQKYGIVTAVADTALTIYSGTDYALANATISSPYFSSVKTPFGFPMNPAKWRIAGGNAGSQASPTINVWYNIGGNIVLPIGAWDLMYTANIYENHSSGDVEVDVTLGTATNNSMDNAFTRANYTATNALTSFVTARKHVLVASKTTIYRNMLTTRSTTTQFWIDLGQGTTESIVAVCAYL